MKGPSTSSGRKPGSYKTFEEKRTRAKSYAAAAVHDQHDAGAIVQAVPKAAAILGHAELATAFRLMTKDPKVHPANAMKGMTGTSTYSVLSLHISIKT